MAPGYEFTKGIPITFATKLTDSRQTLATDADATDYRLHIHAGHMAIRTFERQQGVIGINRATISLHYQN